MAKVKKGCVDGAQVQHFSVTSSIVKKNNNNVSSGCVFHHVFLSPPQDTLNRKAFGQDLPSVENEVEEHNIFQSEVEALVPHLPKTGDKVRPQGVSAKSTCDATATQRLSPFLRNSRTLEPLNIYLYFSLNLKKNLDWRFLFFAQNGISNVCSKGIPENFKIVVLFFVCLPRIHKKPKQQPKQAQTLT